MAFTRTRTGCYTCREDGYKCDEQKPFCGRCIRLGKDCKGYGLKLKWQTPIVRPHHAGKSSRATRKQSVSSPTALARRQRQVQLQQQAVSVVPRAMSSGIAPVPAYLLDHWLVTLAPMITMAPTVLNPFHAHITPMIAHSSTLRSAICFMAANHLSVLKNDNSLSNIATELQTNAIASLWRTIDTEDPQVSLAVVIVLEMTDRLFATTSGVNHLQGAKEIIRRAGPGVWDSGAGPFLLNVCSYYDAMASVSSRKAPVLRLGDEILIQESMKPVENLKVLWAIIGRISSMSDQGESLRDDQGAAIELILRVLDTSNVEGDSARTVHAYKEAAYIYLHRLWHNIGSSHPLALKHARDCLNHIFAVPVTSSLVLGHSWPLWTAACETIDPTLRDRVRERVKAMYEFRRLPALQRLEQDIEEVWKMKDKERAATGVDGIDCVRAILTIRQRGPDLI
ncbi:fungal-specific transcription factor domain-containing protein [Nemania sp. FL0031]|nr:fungal-specific transcription factor domain-containing protein [Nemania sp. FL0031]